MHMGSRGVLEHGALLRLLLLLVLALAVALLGALLGAYALRTWPWLTNLGIIWTALLVIAALFALALAFLSLTSWIRFVRCGGHHASEALLSWLPVGFLIALCTLCGQLLERPVIESPVVAGEGYLGVVFGQRAAHDTIYVPFFHREGKSIRGKTCDPKQTDFGPAARFDDDYKGLSDALVDLGKSFAACKSPTLPVVLDVRGFASTSEFNGEKSRSCDLVMQDKADKRTVSDHLNLKLAEARRAEVIRLLRKGDPDHAIIFEPAGEQRWVDNPRAMQDALNFHDRNGYEIDAGYNQLKGALNRRVEIEIVSKGGCDPRLHALAPAASSTLGGMRAQ
jgi:hypothetical protein